MENKQHITWEYIAGFFDGEGCISIKRRSRKEHRHLKRISCNLTQAEFQGQVIYRIRDFLLRNKIWNKVYRNETGRKNAILHLHIDSHIEMKKFLTKILPFLIVKRKKALTALAYCESKIDNPISFEDEDMIINLNESGLTIYQIVEKTGERTTPPLSRVY